MKELTTIISKYEALKASQQDAVLASVVHVAGSSYRRAGARMLIDAFGNMTGAISGGCLEGDALKKALLALSQAKNKLVTYDTSDENDAAIGAQLGCNGVIQVLFEPIDFQNNKNPIELLKQANSGKEKAVLVTVFNLDKSKEQRGTCAYVTENTNDVSNPTWEEEIQNTLDSDASRFVEFQSDKGSEQVFFQLMQIPVQLVIVGAGFDAIVLSEMADLLGWDITVADGRPEQANASRFQSSCTVVVSKPEHVLAHISVSEKTAVVLLTHNYHYDLAVLKTVLEKRMPKYIGILGPKKKFNRMLEDLKVAEVYPNEDQMQRIYAPVGVAMGAETPSEIALSILSEIQMVMHNEKPILLRDKEGPIHNHKNGAFVRKTIDA